MFPIIRGKDRGKDYADVMVGVRARVNRGSVAFKGGWPEGGWLEVHSPEAQPPSFCGVRLDRKDLEYIHERVIRLNEIMRDNGGESYAGMVVTLVYL